ncbi:EAL domain-containing protein [Rheinheimera sp.]|uniref:EAL domain-containing protein n=1 Tax=Rheinheimera sp. TaxID=1869214 RepID=UPI00307EE104
MIKARYLPVLVALVVLLLTALFSGYIRYAELKNSEVKSAVIAQQVGNNLEVFSADRVRAMQDLIGSWPVNHFNHVDWFNVRSRTLARMLPGFADILLLDKQGRLLWSINKEFREQTAVADWPELRQDLPKLAGEAKALLIQLPERSYNLMIWPVLSEHAKYGYIAAVFDTAQILTVLTGGLEQDDLSFAVLDEQRLVKQHNVFFSERSVSEQPLEFAGRPWLFRVQSQPVGLSISVLVLLLGVFIACISALILTHSLGKQRLLASHEAKYRRLVEGLQGHFIYRASRDWQVEFVSESVSHILGYSAAEFQQHHLDYISKAPEERALAQAVIARGETPEPYLVEYRTPGGDHRLIEYRDAPVLGDQGQLIAIEGIGRDVTAEHAMQQKIRYQADHDQLTGLLNRYAFNRQLEQLLTKGADCCLCYIDMDQFKLVNDSCGHLAGDELLRHIAGILALDLGEKDVLARVGGDEFCLIYFGLTLEQVEDRLRSLLRRISEYRFVWQQHVFEIGASIGVMALSGKGHNAVSVVQAVDSGCYQAKVSGKNRYFVVHDKMEQLNHRQFELKLLHTVQQALTHQQFQLYYQQIKPLDPHCQELHYEVLLRLQSAEGEWISPAIFIPLAERHGLMQQLDAYVFDRVMTELERQPDHLGRLTKCAINLSGLSLGDEQLLATISQRFARSKVRPDQICFEITETAAVSNMASASRFINNLRQIGCRFSLDDFGVGMSSFSYLKHMKVDYVKIDGSFVRNMKLDSADRAMVKAIAEIAQSLGKECIAEFVSDPESVYWLQQFGVRYGQGYSLHQPEPMTRLWSAEPQIFALPQAGNA